MTTTKWWTAGAALVMVVIVALGWVLGIEPRLTEARVADEERATVVTLNASYEDVLVKLKKLDEDLPALSSELDSLRAALPADAQISTLLGQLNALAAESGVVLTAITAGVPAPFESADVAAETPVAAGEGEADADEAGADEAGADAAAAPVQAGPDNFVSVPISVTAAGAAPGVLDFVQRVQFGTRLFVVDGLTVIYEEASGSVTIEGLVYVLTDGTRGGETAPAEGD